MSVVTVPARGTVSQAIARKHNWFFVALALLKLDDDVNRAHVIAHAVSDEVKSALPGVIDVIVHIEPAESGPAFVPTS